MEKVGTNKKPKRKTKTNKQYERFQKTARDLGVDDKESAEKFEGAFKKIVPPRSKSFSG